MAVALREKMAPSSRDECSKIVWIDAVTLHHQMNDRIGKHVFKKRLAAETFLMRPPHNFFPGLPLIIL